MAGHGRRPFHDPGRLGTVGQVGRPVGAVPGEGFLRRGRSGRIAPGRPGLRTGWARPRAALGQGRVDLGHPTGDQHGPEGVHHDVVIALVPEEAVVPQAQQGVLEEPVPGDVHGACHRGVQPCAGLILGIRSGAEVDHVEGPVGGIGEGLLDLSAFLGESDVQCFGLGHDLPQSPLEQNGVQGSMDLQIFTYPEYTPAFRQALLGDPYFVLRGRERQCDTSSERQVPTSGDFPPNSRVEEERKVKVKFRKTSGKLPGSGIGRPPGHGESGSPSLPMFGATAPVKTFGNLTRVLPAVKKCFPSCPAAAVPV